MRIVAIQIIIYAFWISLVFLIALAHFNNLGVNKLINYSNKKSIVFSLPQGWGFLRKTPNLYLLIAI